MQQHHIKSLELLDKFISETPENELKDLIKYFENLDIPGITFEEYMNIYGRNYLKNYGK